jgi:hypothetical protein
MRRHIAMSQRLQTRQHQQTCGQTGRSRESEHEKLPLRPATWQSKVSDLSADRTTY